MLSPYNRCNYITGRAWVASVGAVAFRGDPFSIRGVAP